MRLFVPDGNFLSKTSPCLLLLCAYVLVFNGRILTGSAHYPFDFEFYHYPLLYYVFVNLKNGVLPLWDASMYSGMPFLNNPQAALFYPPHLAVFGILFLSGVDFSLYAMQYLNVIHFLLAGVSFFFFLRDLDFSPRYSLAGGLLFVSNGFLIAQSQHLGVIEILSWAPLGLLLVRRSVQTCRWIYSYLLALALAVMFLAGFFPEFISFLTVAGAYASYLILQKRQQRGKALLRLTVSLLLLAGLTAVAYLPMIEYLPYALSLDIHGGLPPTVLATAFVPDLFNTRDLNRYWGPADSTASFFYGGLLLPLFLPRGLRLKRKELLFFTFLLAATLFLCFQPTSSYLVAPFQGLPLIGALFRPVNFLGYFVLSEIVLALAGFQSLERRQYLKLASPACMMAVLLSMGLGFWSGRCAPGKAAPALLLLAVIYISAYIPWKNWKALLTGVLLLDLWLANYNLPIHTFPGPPASIGADYVDRPDSDIIRFLQSDRGIFRISVDQENLGGPWNAGFRVWGLETMNGFDPLLRRDYLDFLQKDITWRTNRTFHVGNLSSETFQFLNIKYYLTINPDPLAHPHFELIKDGFYKIYRYRRFLPRYLLLSGEWAEAATSGRIDLKAIPPRAVGVRVIKYSTNVRVLEVASPEHNSLLFMSEIDYPGWRLFIDGKENRFLHVNGLFLGAVISEGVHEVRLVFEPRSFKYGVLISGLTLSGLLLLLAKRRTL